MKAKTIIAAILIVCAGLFFTSSIHAQTPYFNFNVGYGLASGSQQLGYNTSSSGSSVTKEAVMGSYGKGLNFGGVFGMMFNKNIGAELGVSYLMGSKYEFTSNSTNSSYTSNTHMNSLRFNPSLVFVPDVRCNLKPYGKVGFSVGMNKGVEERENISTSASISSITVQKVKATGGIGMGFTAAVGFNVEVSKQMMFFAEVNMNSMNWAPKKGETTEYTVDGKDMLPSMTTSQKEIEYVKDFTTNYMNPPSASEPTKVLKESYPLSSVGINAGIKVKLGK